MKELYCSCKNRDSHRILILKVIEIQLSRYTALRRVESERKKERGREREEERKKRKSTYKLRLFSYEYLVYVPYNTIMYVSNVGM